MNTKEKVEFLMASEHYKELPEVNFLEFDEEDELDYLVVYPKQDFIESALNDNCIPIGNYDFYKTLDELTEIKEKQRKEIEETIKDLEDDIFISAEPEIIEKKSGYDPYDRGNSIGWRIKFEIDWSKALTKNKK